jgi:hypothetical protein
LVRPEGYERWTFVATSLGIDYSDEAPRHSGPGDFHNVYVQPEAFDYFVQHGVFPEKTIFVMTNSPAKQKNGADSISKRGHFAGRATGLEVSVKDTERFSESWAYFLFTTAGPSRAAKHLPQQTCYDCHAEHARVDNVFLQFYSVLETAREAGRSR